MTQNGVYDNRGHLLTVHSEGVLGGGGGANENLTYLTVLDETGFGLPNSFPLDSLGNGILYNNQGAVPSLATGANLPTVEALFTRQLILAPQQYVADTASGFINTAGFGIGDHIEINLQFRSTVAAHFDDLILWLNQDATSANYISAGQWTDGATNQPFRENADPGMRINRAAVGASGNAGWWSHCRIRLYNYLLTDRTKVLMADWATSSRDAAGSQIVGMSQAYYEVQNTVITRVDWKCRQGNILAGSRYWVDRIGYRSA